MKISTKIVAVAFVMAIALVAVSASAANFTSDLTVGSTGAQVTALQTVVGVTPATGYFGPITKAAVIKFQVANGVPGTGYVGPLTRAALNGAAPVTSTVGGCAAGAAFSATTGAPCTSNTSTVPGCAAGAAFSATTGASCTGSVVSANGTDGTLTAAQSSYVSSGINLKKGDTKNVLAVTLKASVGPVTVTRAGVHFNTRPWLLFGQLTLKDSTGKILATKTLSSSADATEITVGSDYLVAFDGINEVVNPGQNIDLVVGASVLPATDKITNNMSVQVAFDTLRTVNGIGWTDSINAGTLSATAGVSNNVFTLSSTGSIADIYTRISPNTPATRQQVTSLTQSTNDVVLGTFSLKSANNNSTLNTLTVTIASTTLTATDATTASTKVFSNLRVYGAGSCTLSNPCGGTLTQASGVTTVVFSNLTIPLSQDTWQDLTVKADIAASSTGTGVTVSVNGASGVVATDANYGNTTYEAGTATSNAMTLTTNSLTVSNTSATLGSSITGVSGSTAITVGYNVLYTYTLTNTSNNDLYVSATSSVMVATTTTGTAASSTLPTIQTVSPTTMAGDTTGATASYDIPAGTSRTFTLAGALRGTAGQTGVNLKITTIYYGTTPATALSQAASVNFGLDNLVTSASF